MKPAQETVTVKSLSNGATLLYEQVPGARTAGFAVLVPVGALHETQGQEGYTHFLEHLVFKGTRRRDAEAISREIAAVGGYLNAYTTKEYTVFYTHLPPEHLALGVDIVGDMLQNAALRPKPFGLEQKVVLEEILLSKDDPQDAMFETHLKRWYRHQGLGRPVLGNPESIEHATPATVRRYFASHYHPQGLVFALAGYLPPKTLKNAVAHLKDWQGPAVLKGAAPQGRQPLSPAPPGEIPLTLYHRPNLGASYLTVTLPIPGYTQPGRFPAMVLARALGSDSSSRLFVEVREKRGLCYDVGSTAVFYKNQGYFEIYATTGHNNLATVLGLCMKEFEKLTRNGLKDDERRRVLEQVRGGFLMSQEGTPNTLNRLVSNQFVFGQPWTEKDFMHMLGRQTLDRLNHFAKSHLGQQTPAISLLTATAQAQTVGKALKAAGFPPAKIEPLDG